jgi:hypothetical protein
MTKYSSFRFFAHPKTFFFGVCLGILICAIYGRKISGENHYENFVRLGGGAATRGISFQVTASQMSALINKTCRQDQILVLAGGSSVFFGSGQPIRYIWTKKLQEKLGVEYCVMNFATPAGGLVGYGSVSLEMVGKRFKNAFLVTDASAVPSSQADGMLWYKHYFWDAYYKGLLTTSTVSYNAERINKINENNMASDAKTSERAEQIRIGMWLDSFLYFNDLWSYVHYTKKLTIYDPLLGPWNWGPLYPITDYDYEIDEVKIRSLQHYPKTDSPQFKSEFEIVRSYSKQYIDIKSGSHMFNERNLISANEAIKKQPLTDIAGHILVVSIPESPYYTQKMTKDEQVDYIAVRKEIVELWRQNGYPAFFMEGFGPEDYGDRPHINTFGGWKLAEKVAEKVKEISHQQ